MSASESTSSPRTLPPDFHLAAACTVLAFAAQLPFAYHHAVLLDEGVVMQMANDITNGKVPYRDGVHYAFPGVFYLTAAVFEVFGTSLEAARLLAAALFAVATGASVLICRWWCSRQEAILFFLLFLAYRAWSFPHWHMINYSPMAVTMSLVAIWATGEHLARTGYRWAIVAGIFCGLAVLAKQDSGGATSVALGIAVLTLRPEPVRHRLTSAVAITSAASTIILGCLIAVWSKGYLEDMIREAIWGPIYGAANFDYLGRPSLFPLFAQDAHFRANQFSYLPQLLMETYGPQILGSALYRDTPAIDIAAKVIYHAPWAIALGVALLLIPAAWRSLQPIARRRRMLVLLAASAFLMAFNRPHDWIHLLVLYPPTLLLIASAIPLTRGRPIVRVAAAATSIALLVGSAHLALRFQSKHSAPVETARGTFYTSPVLADGFREVLGAIDETAADTPLLAYPYHTFLNFLANRPPRTRYMYLWPVEWNKERDDEIIATIEAAPKTLILYSPSQLVHLGSPRDFAERLFEYLAANYTIDRSYGIETPGLSFLQLRREPAPDRSAMLRRIESDAIVTKQPRNGVASEIPRGIDTFVRIADWPFRRVVELKTQPAAEVALRIPVTPRLGDRLSTGYATNPDHWEYLFSPPVRFRLAVVDKDRSERTLIEREIQHGTNPGQRRWFDVELDLSPWAGQSIEIVLGVFTRWGTKPSFDLAAWEVPVIGNRASAADDLR